MSEQPSFDALMARLRAGNQDAAAELYQMYSRRLIALARTRLTGRLQAKVDAEDVIQSALKSFFLRQTDSPFDLKNWDSLWSLLVGITLRKCGHRIEHFYAARRSVDREVAAPSPEDSSASWEAVAREPTPSEAAILSETVERLMQQLPEKDQEVVTLSLQGYTIPEISSQVARSERTIHRVLGRVRDYLQQLRDCEAV